MKMKKQNGLVKIICLIGLALMIGGCSTIDSVPTSTQIPPTPTNTVMPTAKPHLVNEWTFLGLEGEQIHNLAIDPSDPNTMYASKVNSGDFFKSSDGGRTWSSAQKSGDCSIAIDPVTPSIIYAGSHNNGLYKSTDAAASWSTKNTGLIAAVLDGKEYPVHSICSIAFDPVTPSTIYIGTDLGVYKSLDRGETWNNLGLEKIVSKVLFDPLSPTTLYVVAWNNVYVTTDGGQSFSDAFSLFTSPIRSLVYDPVSAGILYVGMEGKVYKSTDNGTSNWWAESQISSKEVFTLAIDPTNPSVIFAGTLGDGVFISKDGGANWAPFNTGLTDLRVKSLIIDPVSRDMLYAATDNGMYVIRFSA